MNDRPTQDAGQTSLFERRTAVFGRGAPQFYERPLHLVRGEGVWLYDAEGRRYLDLYNNIPVVGHCNPRVVEAMSRQAATHTTHSRYLDEEIVIYAERLLGLLDSSIEQVVFTCTGSEANDVAMQMAMMATGGSGFICTDATYHGNTALVARLTRAPRRGRPDVHAVPFPQRYRPIVEGLDEAALCDAYVAEVQEAVDDFASAGVPLAGIVLCSLFANEGLPDVPHGFVQRACEVVRRAGGVVIMDEVQSGFCRSGRWWGYELLGVTPDIVTMGKPMGNGLPMGACAARADLVAGFRRQTRYFNTFAATPVHGAVGAAVLDELERWSMPDHAADVGEHLLSGLRSLAADAAHVGDVRGHGLFLGVEWVTDRESKQPDPRGAAAVANRLRERGILLSNAGAHGNVLKVRPPLVIEREHADLFLSAFGSTLEEFGG